MKDVIYETLEEIHCYSQVASPLLEHYSWPLALPRSPREPPENEAAAAVFGLELRRL